MIEYTQDIRIALQHADLAIIATEWESIKQIPLKNFILYMKEPIVIDGRNCYSLKEIRKYPMTYISIGRPTIMNELLEKWDLLMGENNGETVTYVL